MLEEEGLLLFSITVHVSPETCIPDVSRKGDFETSNLSN
jgi:hypothetical protein